MFSMSVRDQGEHKIINPGSVNPSGVPVQTFQPEDMAKSVALHQMSQQFMGTMGMDMMKSEGKGFGSINPVKGVMEPDMRMIRWGYDARGLREKFFTLSHEILREISHRVGVVSAIQNVRIMQLKPFANVAYSENDVGFMAKLKKKEATATGKDKKIMAEIEDFVLHCGYTNIPDDDAREREGLESVFEMVTRDTMTIDQIAISLRRNKKGKLLDFFVLDGATIKRIMPGKEKNFGGPDTKFVQEVSGIITEAFTPDDLLFTFMHRRSDIRKRAYGYSYIEMCMDMITAWLFAMAYNKNIFNDNSMPKGIISFDGDKVDQTQLEELQRQWLSMFRGIKGMWKTPFLNYNAKWNPIAPSNRDMEYNEYTQMLSSWICAIHGIDAQEMGIRLNQANNVLNENAESKIQYSRDRGLKSLLNFHSTWINNLIDRVPEWKDYKIVFTGMEAKSQINILEVDEKEIGTYKTLNEKRKEKDLPPLEGGDIVLNNVFMASKQSLDQQKAQEQQQSMMQQGGQEGMDQGQDQSGQPEGQNEGQEGSQDQGQGQTPDTKQFMQSVLGKSMGVKKKTHEEKIGEFIEFDL